MLKKIADIDIMAEEGMGKNVNVDAVVAELAKMFPAYKIRARSRETCGAWIAHDVLHRRYSSLIPFSEIHAVTNISS